MISFNVIHVTDDTAVFTIEQQIAIDKEGVRYNFTGSVMSILQKVWSTEHRHALTRCVFRRANIFLLLAVLPSVASKLPLHQSEVS